MAMAGADPFAIMKAMGHSDLQMTMHYVSLGKSHIREQVEKLNSIQLLPSLAPRMKALPAPACVN
jgi:integrase